MATRGPSQWQSLKNGFSKFGANPQMNPELSKNISQVTNLSEQSYGFDPAVRSTIVTRERHLALYQSLMEGCAKLNNIAIDSAAAFDSYCWADDRIEANLRLYLTCIAHEAPSYSRNGTPLAYKTLQAHRDSILYWAGMKCSDNVERASLTKAANEAIQHVRRVLGQNDSVNTKPKVYLTRFDLAGLIEYDAARTQGPDVAHQQHLCWLLGLVTGVRPGSIGYAKDHHQQYLQCKDIQIRRMGTTISKPGSLIDGSKDTARKIGSSESTHHS